MWQQNPSDTPIQRADKVIFSALFIVTFIQVYNKYNDGSKCADLAESPKHVMFLIEMKTAISYNHEKKKQLFPPKKEKQETKSNAK